MVHVEIGITVSMPKRPRLPARHLRSLVVPASNLVTYYGLVVRLHVSPLVSSVLDLCLRPALCFGSLTS